MVFVQLASLLSLGTSFTTSDSVEALLDVLASPCGVTLLALEVEQTRARVSCHLCLDALAAQTTHILLNILLVQTVDHGALVPTLKQDVSFCAKVTFDIHFSLEEVKDVSRLTVELVTEDLKVLDGRLGADETRLGQLTALVLRLLVNLARFLVHDGLDAVKQIRVLVLLVALQVPVEHLYSSKRKLVRHGGNGYVLKVDLTYERYQQQQRWHRQQRASSSASSSFSCLAWRNQSRHYLRLRPTNLRQFWALQPYLCFNFCTRQKINY